jgi:hypothetical protein
VNKTYNPLHRSQKSENYFINALPAIIDPLIILSLLMPILGEMGELEKWSIWANGMIDCLGSTFVRQLMGVE